MNKHAYNQDTSHQYCPNRLVSKRKEEITPWSFYQENGDVKSFLDSPVVLTGNTNIPESKNANAKARSHKSHKSHKSGSEMPPLIESKHRRIPSKTPVLDPELLRKQQNLKVFEELKVISKEISELLRERIILRAVAKYMELSNQSPVKKEPPKKSIAEINFSTSLEHEQSKELHRKSEEKAFNDIQMQIHSMPPELKQRLSKKQSGRLSPLRSDSSSYAEYNFKHSIEVSGERKPFSLKQG